MAKILIFSNFRNFVPSLTTISKQFSSWKSYTITLIKVSLNALTTVSAFFLYPLMARSVVFSSTKKFKKKFCALRIQESLKTLERIGGDSITLKHSLGYSLGGMHFNFEKCLLSLQEKGAIVGQITLPSGEFQRVLFLQTEESLSLMEKMGVPIVKENGNSYIVIGLPAKSREELMQKKNPGTMIYAPGSGHIYEFRRKTIQQFLFGYGMNVLVVHYSGTGMSKGKISEQATYDDMKACYDYLIQDRQVNPSKILAYGHCMGGGPATDLASKHPINLFVDRTVETMGRFAKLRVKTILRIPNCLNFLVGWVEPVMNKGFHYDNETKIQKIKGFVAVAGATEDKLIPPSYLKTLFNKAFNSKDRILFYMNSGHDEDFGSTDGKAREILGKFLQKADLVG